MDSNQRSEANNQTNNGANEKWTPGSKGNTTSGPMDHTYPQGASQQQGQQAPGQMGTQQSGAGPGASDGGLFDRDDTRTPPRSGELPGGSMQSQQTGGSGPQQGITDSHQRQMEMHSGAYGLLEQPVGRRPNDSGTDLLRDFPSNRQANTQATHQMNPQNAAQPELQGGSLGRHHGVPQGTTGPAAHGTEAGMPAAQQGGVYGNRQGAAGTGSAGAVQLSDDAVGASFGASHSSHEPTEGSSPGNPSRASGAPLTGPSDPNRSFQSGSGHPPQSGAGQSQQGGAGQAQQSTDRAGSQTGSEGREIGAEDIHQSNDVAGGLPRSPGNSGPRTENQGYRPGGSMQQDPAVHESNDAAGGYPRSPAGANKLSGDKKMDDDTGFSRK